MSNEQAPECCPFCGAGPITEGEEKWTSEIGKYRCGTISHAFEPDDRWQTYQCRIAERERLTRERDEARALAQRTVEKHCDTSFKLGETEGQLASTLARVQRLEDAGDAIVDHNIGCGCGQDGPCRACRMACEAWTKAKEATP